MNESLNALADELQEIVVQLKSCKYECVAGPLENNVSFMRLEQLAESTKKYATLEHYFKGETIND